MPFDALYQKIERAKLKCRLKDPQLADLLNHWVIELSDTQRTAATDGLKIYYGRSFIAHQTTDEVLFVLLHELMHILLEHLPRRHGRHPRKFNVACDIVVNDLLTHHGFDSGNLPVVTGRPFKIRGHRTHVENVYDQLPINPRKENFDSHALWDDVDPEIVKSILKEIQRSPYASKLLKRILPSYQKRAWPSLRDMLAQFLALKINDYSFDRRDSRISDLILPGFNPAQQVLEDIWIVVDVSGSMEKNVLTRLAQGFVDAFRRFPSLNVQLSFFSTIVTRPRQINKPQDIERAFADIDSTGGTNFSEIFVQFPSLFPDQRPSVSIVVTDGYGPAPKESLNPGNETWWALTTRSDFTPHFGRCVHL